MNKVQKPDFSSARKGYVDHQFIPDTIRAELRLHLQPSPLTQSQQESLINFANNMGQAVFDADLETGKRQREQIEAVAADAARLLSSLRKLGQPACRMLSAETDYLAVASAPPIEIDDRIKAAIKQEDGGLLSSAWDWVEALEKTASYTIEQFNIDKQSKPEQMRARNYISLLADRVREVTGEAPPKDPAAWFHAFVTCLVNFIDSPIGTRVVKSGIEAIR